MAYNFNADFGNYINRAASVLTATDPRPLSVTFRLKQTSAVGGGADINSIIYNNNWSNSADSPGFVVVILGSSDGTQTALNCCSNEQFGVTGTWVASDTSNFVGWGLTWAAGSPGAVAFYRNGATNGTSSQSFGGNTTNGCSVGRWKNYSDLVLNGILAELAIWNVVLTSDEMIAVTGGVCPLLVRPASLMSYVPMTGTFNQDLKLGDWTSNGTPTKTDGPRVLKPSTGIIVPKAGSSPPPAVSFPWRRPMRAQQHLLVR